MEVITPKSLTNALKDFRAKGDARWIDEGELGDKAREIVDEYLEDATGLSDEDMADILAPGPKGTTDDILDVEPGD